MTRSWLSLGWLCPWVLCLLPLVAAGQTEPELGLHQAAVEVPDQSPGARSEGLVRAFGDLLTRLTGDAATRALQHPQVQAALAQPDRYLQRYEYRQELFRPEPGAPAQRRWLLVASFHPPSVEQLLLASGFAVWGEDRPALMACLTVDGQPGAADLAGGFVQRARARGLALRWPEGDVTALVAAADAELVAVARRLGASYLLVADLSPSSAVTPRLVLGGEVQPLAFRTDGGDPQAELVDRTLTAMSRHYATLQRAAPSDVLVRIEGVEDLASFRALIGGLSRAAQIRKVTVVSADADALTLKLAVPGGGERLDVALSGVPRLAVVDAGANPARLSFRR